MDVIAHDSSDDELSLPRLQLNAVTEALLADLDPTGTATQDERGVHRRRHFEAKHGNNEWASAATADSAASPRAKHAPHAEAVGGDSVSLGPRFTSMQKPPRRPRKLVNFEEPDEEPSSTEAGSNERQGDLYGMAELDRAAQRDGGDASGHETRPVKRRSYHESVADEVIQADTLERPMRRVVIRTQKRPGTSPTPASALPPSPPRQATGVPDREPATATTEATKTEQAPPVRHRRVVVNDIPYRIIKKLGRGGSGRVYEVMAPDTQAWAFKAIPLATLDARARRQIKNEVALLQSLRTCNRVAYLKDWCVDESKNAIHIVMELGQIDLENIIKDHYELEEKLDPVFVGYYWREMLHCIAAIHSLDIVHSDIKPANFVSIKGILKIVDFGIAHCLPDDTLNIYLDHLAGTPNYMAPETLRVLSSSRRTTDDDSTAASRLVRFGKPSDMWSLGVVLHLMVYGRQPFSHIRGMAPKLLAITDPSHAIELEKHGLGAVRVPESLLRTMKACLTREATKRPTAAGLLAGGADGLVPIREGDTERKRELGRVIGNAIADVTQLPISRQELEIWVEDALEELT